MMRKVFVALVIVCVFLAAKSITPVHAESSLNQFILSKMEQAKLPGLAACIVKNGKIQWVKGYGWADIENRVPVTQSTIFGVASISKSVTATALMQLHEQGRFHLDDDVSDYLPFPVRNPNHPLAAITFRQLITHTSSIKHGFEVVNASRVHGDTSRPLGVFMEQYFVPGGRYYSKENFHKYSPGKKWNYSTVAFGLAGYLVEVISGMPFPDYCKKQLFGPLGMQATRWFRSELDPARVAKMYKYDAVSQGFKPIAPYKYADYPGAGLHTSVADLSRFLIAHIQRGQIDGVRILEAETEAEMRRTQFPDGAHWQCLGFFNYSDGYRYIGEDGGDYGMVASMWFRPSDGAGVIMMGNRSLGGKAYDVWNEIYYRLFEEADRL